MTVYVELVFIENFIVDYFLLLSSSKITSVKHKHAFLGATFGALYACIMPLFYDFAPVAQRILVLFGMCAITFTFKSIKNVVLTCVTVSVCASCLFGIINLIFASVIEGLFYTDNLLFIVMLCSAFFAFLLFNLIIPFMREKKIKSAVCKLRLGDSTVTAFIDSGNSLYYKKTPVVLVNKNAIKEYANPVMPLIIPYSAVKESGALIGFRPQSAFIMYSDKIKEIDCVVALCDHNFNNKFDALLHPDLFKECV